MDNDHLILILRKLLGVDQDVNLEFLGALGEDDLKTLIACIRGRIEQLGRQ